jgi:tripartite-type tricarboxylate transporter receptor subunit TctC
MTQAIRVSTARTPNGKSDRASMPWFGGMEHLLRAAAVTILMTSATYAQSGFPTRPVTMVVPFAPGGVTDIMTRSLSQELQSITGQPFVVMNKPGGTGSIAAQFVKAAAHDGYTVLIGTGSQMSVLPALKSNTPFDPEKDFTAISLLGTTPYVLLVNSSVPAKSLPELIALLQANPGKFNYSTSGFGSLPHLAGEMFKQMAKVEMAHVPYPGNSPATTAAVSGVVQITFDSPLSSLPHVQAGTLRALAVASEHPIDALPGVPTIGSMLPGFVAESWLCLYVAAGTPPAIVERLRAVTDQAVQRPQFLKTAQTGGFDVPRLSAEEMAKFLRDDAARWREVTKSANIVVE